MFTEKNFFAGINSNMTLWKLDWSTANHRRLHPVTMNKVMDLDKIHNKGGTATDYLVPAIAERSFFIDKLHS